MEQTWYIGYIFIGSVTAAFYKSNDTEKGSLEKFRTRTISDCKSLRVNPPN